MGCGSSASYRGNQGVEEPILPPGGGLRETAVGSPPSSGVAVEDPANVLVYIKPTAANLETKVAKSFHGIFNRGSKVCYVSFPGKYAPGWKALTDYDEHGADVACVFLTTKEDGLGQHAMDPDSEEQCCYCRRLYGKGVLTNGDRTVPRSCKSFGYLKVVDTKPTRSEQQEKEAEGTVLLHAQASKDCCRGGWMTATADFGLVWRCQNTADKAWQKAEMIMATNDFRPSWGCAWFQKWKENVQKANEARQTLVVVFFRDMLGRGRVSWDDLASVDLWDDIGLGGSQKGEVAYLEKEGYAYESMDIAEFVGERCIYKPADSGILKDKALQKAIQKEMRKCLGFAMSAVATTRRSASGSPMLSFNMDPSKWKKIAHLQTLRDAVLTGKLEASIASLAQGLLKIDCSAFAEMYERQVLRPEGLTKQQKGALKHLHKIEEKQGTCHLVAPAGAGKTFVAVEKACGFLRDSDFGKLLFVAPREPLCHLFLRMVHNRLLSKHKLKRLYMLFAPAELGARQVHVDAQNMVTLKALQERKLDFDLVIVDEAHHVFSSRFFRACLERIEAEKNPRCKVMLLSDQSQCNVITVAYPRVETVSLKEVVRSTGRLVEASKAFSMAEESDAAGVCHHWSRGPPLRSRLFQAAEAKSTAYFQKYAEEVTAAVRDVASSYPTLNLHNRVAILVPDNDFLTELQGPLSKELEHQAPHRPFSLCSAMTSMTFLPLDADSKASTLKEFIVYDTVENFDGMEKLIVLAVGLDDASSAEEDRRATRSLLYRALTRANLLCVVINDSVPGGWLQFLGLLKFGQEKKSKQSTLTVQHKAAASHLQQPPTTSATMSMGTTSASSSQDGPPASEAPQTHDMGTTAASRGSHAAAASSSQGAAASPQGVFAPAYVPQDVWDTSNSFALEPESLLSLDFLPYDHGVVAERLFAPLQDERLSLSLDIDRKLSVVDPASLTVEEYSRRMLEIHGHRDDVLRRIMQQEDVLRSRFATPGSAVANAQDDFEWLMQPLLRQKGRISADAHNEISALDPGRLAPELYAQRMSEIGDRRTSMLEVIKKQEEMIRVAFTSRR